MIIKEGLHQWLTKFYSYTGKSGVMKSKFKLNQQLAVEICKPMIRKSKKHVHV